MCNKLLRHVALPLGENKIYRPKCNHTCHRRAAGAMSVTIRYILHDSSIYNFQILCAIYVEINLSATAQDLQSMRFCCSEMK